jgi:hypothetical protein
MSESDHKIRSNEAGTLRQRLRAEAERDAPAFSEALHERIMARLAQAPAPVGGQPVMRWSPPMRLAAAVAVAGTLAAGIYWMMRPTDTRIANNPPRPTPDDVRIDVFTTALGRSQSLPLHLATDLRPPQLAALTEDSRDLARFMLDTLPQWPVRQSDAPGGT